MRPTPEQEAILSAARGSAANLLIEALAGAAKTTTLELLARSLPPQATLSLAFNKRIAEEMTKKLPSHVTCKTLNSVGHFAWARVIGAKRLTLNGRKSYELLKEATDKLSQSEKQELFPYFKSMLDAIRKAKSIGYVPEKHSNLSKGLVSEAEFWEACEIDGDEVPPLQREIVNKVLSASIKFSYQGTIDFDDQIYMSALFGTTFDQYPLVMVDEAQDLSPLNHAMLARIAKQRLIAVGDRWQSIYQFRGAASDSMQRLQADFKMRNMPLSISFRCPRTIVALARSRAPNMQCPEWAIEGSVTHHEDKFPTLAGEAAIICRNNAPLFALALRLLRERRPVKLHGSDIGPQLIKLLKTICTGAGTRDPITAIDEWVNKKLATAKDHQKNSIADRGEALRVFAEEGGSLDGAVAYAEAILAQEGTIQLMSGHKAKGLEFDTVYHLDSWRIPSKHAKRSEENGNSEPLEQEANLNYVITTRAKRDLHFCNLPRRDVYHA